MKNNRKNAYSVQLPKLNVAGSNPVSRSIFSMIGVYILYSAALDQFYAGLSRHPQRRLKQHLRGQSPWTSRAGDWVMVYQSRCDTMAEARAMEKRIKQHGARRFLEE